MGSIPLNLTVCSAAPVMELFARFKLPLILLAAFAAAALLRRKFRRQLRKPRDWDTLILFSLAICVGLTLVISWHGAWLSSKHHGDWLHEGLRALFSVLEGDSQDFRAYAGFLPAVRVAAEILAALVPLLTVGTVLTLLWNRLPHHIPMFGKVWYIFSELEPHSIHLAKSIHDPAGVYIFLRSRRGSQNPELLEQLQELNYHLYPRTERELLIPFWRRRKKMRFFFLSENTDENFTRIDQFLWDVEQKHLFLKFPPHPLDGDYQQELYLLSETQSAPMLIDHLRGKMKENGKTKDIFRSAELRLLDRYRAMSYHLLHQAPIHHDRGEKRANILVLGFGRIGSEFFRTASSMGIIPEWETTFTLCDLNMRRRWASFTQQCPALKDARNVTTKLLNAESHHLSRLLDAEDFTYILVALGDDERNIKIATWLHRYYRRRHWENLSLRQPQICVNIEDPVKSAYTRELYAGKQDWERSIHVFGTVSEAFSAEVLMPRTLWMAARWVHQKLNNLSPDQPIDWNEYERRSSIACAAHAEYHLAAFPGRYRQELDARQRAPKEMDALIMTEHRRWMAYVQGEGMQRADMALVERYCAEVGSHVETKARLTPCLIEGKEELQQVYQQVNHLPVNVRREGRSFWERDTFIIHHAPDIHRIIHDGTYPEPPK